MELREKNQIGQGNLIDDDMAAVKRQMTQVLQTLSKSEHSRIETDQRLLDYEQRLAHYDSIFSNRKAFV
jgi:hypothetical protein